MELPLILFLILYFIPLLVFGVMTAINIYHLRRFGIRDQANQTFLIVFSVYCLVVLVATMLYLASVDWGENVSISIPLITL